MECRTLLLHLNSPIIECTLKNQLSVVEKQLINPKSMKKFVLFMVLLSAVLGKSYGQSGTGLPIWPFTSEGQIVLNDWRTVPPVVTSLSNSDLVSGGSSGGIAFDKCGEVVFYVLHEGSKTDETSLFIFNAAGESILTNSTPNGPGLFGQGSDSEVQVIKVPTYDDEWYVIYRSWRNPWSAPLGDGVYIPYFIKYSRVSYDGNELTVIERDVILVDDNGVSNDYVDGKAVSRTGPVPNSHYLYLSSRSRNEENFEGHRFIIDSEGITFEKSTGEVVEALLSINAEK